MNLPTVLFSLLDEAIAGFDSHFASHFSFFQSL